MDRGLLTHVLAPLSLVVVALFWNQPFHVLAGLVVIAGMMLYLRGSKTDIVFFVTAGLAGTAAEAIAIYFGAWNYGNSQLLGVPIWLPVLWGIAALFTDRLHHEFLDVRKWYINHPDSLPELLAPSRLVYKLAGSNQKA